MLSIVRVLFVLTMLLVTHSLSFAEADSQEQKSAALRYKVLPQQVVLTGPRASQQLMVQSVTQEELGAQITKGMQFQSNDTNVVKVEEGRLVPTGNGTTTVSVTVGDDSNSVKVTVEKFEQPMEITFRNHVLPVLSKANCNSGACHGALAGKGGFKLSLRGYHAAGDYFTITKQDRGRRVELSAPARSLFLTKPSGAIPHKGGVRFEVDSHDYRILSEWIAKGATPPDETDVRLQKLSVFPQRVLLQPGEEQQLILQAHYSDGRVEDVTHWAKFTSADETVATVNENGKLQVVGYGEGAIVVWFSSQLANARVTSLYPYKIAPEAFTKESPVNVVDELVMKQLQRLNLKPSPKCSDEVFLRRVYLDTIGTLPQVEEVRQFLSSDDPQKRTKVIDSLLSRTEFVDYWTYKWSDVLMINGTLLRPEAVRTYYQWVHSHVKANTPWDQFVREIVTAKGVSTQNGATNFYALHQEPETMTENVSKAFLGLSIECAKCHNHPLEKWTNDQYYAMANMFARVRAKGWGGDSRNGDGIRTLYVMPRGDLIQPATGKAQSPTPLDGEPIPFDDPTDRRIHLANWLTSPQNPYFTKAVANRVWANFMGVGLVEDVDDMRASNPASNEELLAALADYLIKEHYNLKSLMKLILVSHAYQRSSEPLEENKKENRFYSRYYPRRLMAEVLLDAISQVTESPSSFTQVEFPGGDKRKTDFYPKGTRAIQLYDSAVSSYFLKTFGRNQRRITCECERSDEPSLVQVLHLSNGKTLNEKLSQKENKIDRLLQKKLTAEELLQEVMLASLTRFPTKTEVANLVPLLESATEKEKRIVVEDLFWSLLTSREFLFNH